MGLRAAGKAAVAMLMDGISKACSLVAHTAALAVEGV